MEPNDVRSGPRISCAWHFIFTRPLQRGVRRRERAYARSLRDAHGEPLLVTLAHGGGTAGKVWQSSRPFRESHRGHVVRSFFELVPLFKPQQTGKFEKDDAERRQATKHGEIDPDDIELHAIFASRSKYCSR